MKAYISPSQQEHNIGVGDYGSEAKRCQDVADRVRRLLVSVGVEVKQTPRAWEPLSDVTWLAKVVNASNDCGADVHVAIHTNASSSSATHGTDAWHYPGSSKGKRLTEAIYKRVVKVSGKGNGIHTSPVFYETAHADAPVCYIELGFHTNKADARSVVDHPGAYARAIAEGVAEYFGVKLPSPVKPAPAPKPIALTDKDITLPRKYKPKPGWWNFDLKRYIREVRAQGDGDRIVAGNADPLIIPVPLKWPTKRLGRKVWAWKKAHRAAQIAEAAKPPATRKKPPFFWLRYKS